MNHFDLGYMMALPFFYGNALYKRRRYGKYKRSLPGMFGKNLPSPPLKPILERVWMHSVSVGETVAAGAFFREMHKRRQDWEYLSTTTTETGQDQSMRSLAQAQYHDFCPADFSWVVRRFLDAYQPSMYIFFETEIWPNILLECGRDGMPIFMVNGKLSDKSARNYAKLRSVLRRPLSQVSAFLMQTEADADRMRSIVGSKAKIHVTGNVKFDGLPRPLQESERRDMRQEFGLDESTLLFLAGSTHQTEEKAILIAFNKYRSHGGPPARLAIAPRHPERFDDVARELENAGAKVHRISNGPAPVEGDVVVLFDRMGVLARSFGAADVALLGGAWNPIGGHNLLEPAAHGIPVIHGPAMHEQKEIMRIVRAWKASRQVEVEMIDEALLHLAQSPQRRTELGEAGRKAASENAGAAVRAVDYIFEFLEKTGT